MSLLPLTMTFWDYDRVRALADGRVRIEGCDAVHFALDIHDIFFRAIRNQEFDVTEMSFSSYMMMVDRGDAPYAAIPVFLSRMWRHSAIYIRTDRGIEGPEDLKGREVGVPEYQVTAALAARGLLADEYGARPRTSPGSPAASKTRAGPRRSPSTCRPASSAGRFPPTGA